MRVSIGVFLLFASPALAASQSDVVHHQLDVSLDPATSTLTATDTVTVPRAVAKDGIRFQLNKDLTVRSLSDGITIEKVGDVVGSCDVGMDRGDGGPASRIEAVSYQVNGAPKSGDVTFSVAIEGVVDYKIAQVGVDYDRGFSESPGMIEERGTYLAGSTCWTPNIPGTLITYDLEVTMPGDWRSVSQGARTETDLVNGTRRDNWAATKPTEEVHVIAAPFTEYAYDAGAVTAMAFLRTPDEELADRYLEATAQYLDMYRDMFGPYPYTKFALVENFWETGYGMPSFTLLGSQVIRFPFILHSSYPHELLHNWWGNGVFVDFASGNWCEGLTSYLADHLVAEQRGQGADYRRSLLQRYTDYVSPEDDFPLTEFRSRYSPATEAVGYGKNAMVWEMLRTKVGDDAFVAAFRRFYDDNAFRIAGYDDIRKAFEAETGKSLGSFFRQWIERPGAPQLELRDVAVKPLRRGFELSFDLTQIQDGPAYDLDVPLAVMTPEGPRTYTVSMNRASQSFDLIVDAEPAKVVVDPQFNLFRRLHHNEIPPALSKAFGADRILFVMPAAASAAETARYERLVELWSRNREDAVEVIADSDLDAIPGDKAVWILGWNNAWRGTVAEGLDGLDAALADDAVRLGTQSLAAADHSVVVAIRNPVDPAMAAIWLTAVDEAAVDGLATKLPHYGKYSYLAFSGENVDNVASGQWPVIDSPLVATLAQDVVEQPLPPRPALAELPPAFSGERMMADVEVLASDAYEGRGVGTAGLDKAAAFIAQRFEELGLAPAGDDGTYFQAFEVANGPDGGPAQVKNVVAALPGTDAEESVVVSAHYDHLGRGWPDARAGFENQIHPGADDNASGVAVLLELARIMAEDDAPPRNVVFLATSAEEAGLLGARHYVQADNPYPVDTTLANVNLDTVGRLDDNNVQVLGSQSAAEWPAIFIDAEEATGITADLLPSGIAASDNAAFAEAGVPAVQLYGSLTSDYHRPTDTADKVDVAGLVKIATLTRELVERVMMRAEPMTFVKSANIAPPAGGSDQRRSVSTGTTPDFAFAGPGVRLVDVKAGSPADLAGLQIGDVIIAMGGEDVADLRAYTNVLSRYAPGDDMPVRYLRDGTESEAILTLVAR